MEKEKVDTSLLAILAIGRHLRKPCYSRLPLKQAWGCSLKDLEICGLSDQLRKGNNCDV